jgi:hypothetical protein
MEIVSKSIGKSNGTGWKELDELMEKVEYAIANAYDAGYDEGFRLRAVIDAQTSQL